LRSYPSFLSRRTRAVRDTRTRAQREWRKFPIFACETRSSRPRGKLHELGRLRPSSVVRFGVTFFVRMDFTNVLTVYSLGRSPSFAREREQDYCSSFATRQRTNQESAAKGLIPFANPQAFVLSLSFGGYQKAFCHLQWSRRQIQRFASWYKQARGSCFTPCRATKRKTRGHTNIF